MVHVFKYKDYNYIYDSGSGSLHECDGKTYAYLAHMLGQTEQAPDLTKEELSEIEGDIAALKEPRLQPALPLLFCRRGRVSFRA